MDSSPDRPSHSQQDSDANTPYSPAEVLPLPSQHDARALPERTAVQPLPPVQIQRSLTIGTPFPPPASVPAPPPAHSSLFPPPANPISESPIAYSDSDSDSTQTHALPPLPEKIVIAHEIAHPDPRAMPLNARRVSMMSLRHSASGVPSRSEADWAREDRPSGGGPGITAGERIAPTLSAARRERDKYAAQARLAGFALNAAIALQVVLGALTTGLSVVTSGHQTQIITAILGGIATIVASYLARARGSNEPERSTARVKDLEQLIRECEAFSMDCGHVFDDSLDGRIGVLRCRLEEVLGNGSGERKASAV